MYVMYTNYAGPKPDTIADPQCIYDSYDLLVSSYAHMMVK